MTTATQTKAGAGGDSTARGHLAAGFTIVELMVAMAIFSILMIVAFSAYQTQMRSASREFASASDEIDLLVVRNILLRDLELAGFGLADNYSALSPQPPNAPYLGTNGGSGPDTLVIRGTSLGLNTRATQGWSYINAAGNYITWGDASENLRFGTSKATSDSFILLEPNTRQLLTFASGYWRFYYDTDAAVQRIGMLDGVADADITDPWPQGTLLYGLVGADKPSDEVTLPYWAVRYYLKVDANPEDRCANGGRRLLRAESLTNASTPGSGEAVATCVLDFQVAFGLDRDEDGSIDAAWDNGGAELAASGWTIAQIKRRLKQVRAYMLVQSGNLDQDDYTYPTATVRVGDAVAGRDLTLTTEQRKYRWKLLTVSVTPRNMR